MVAKFQKISPLNADCCLGNGLFKVVELKATPSESFPVAFTIFTFPFTFAASVVEIDACSF